MNLLEAVKEAQRLNRPFRPVRWREWYAWCVVDTLADKICTRGPVASQNLAWRPTLTDTFGEWEVITYDQLAAENLERERLASWR